MTFHETFSNRRVTLLVATPAYKTITELASSSPSFVRKLSNYSRDMTIPEPAATDDPTADDPVDPQIPADEPENNVQALAQMETYATQWRNTLQYLKAWIDEAEDKVAQLVRIDVELGETNEAFLKDVDEDIKKAKERLRNATKEYHEMRIEIVGFRRQVLGIQRTA